jgi:hypothetical protein
LNPMSRDGFFYVQYTRQCVVSSDSELDILYLLSDYSIQALLARLLCF